MIKTCGICGKEFEPLSNSGKYCSDPCRRIAHLEKNKIWIKSHPEKAREYKRRYYRKKKGILPKGYDKCRAAHNDCESCEYDDCIF